MFLVKSVSFIYTAHENSKLFKRIANVGTQSIVETECSIDFAKQSFSTVKEVFFIFFR